MGYPSMGNFLSQSGSNFSRWSGPLCGQSSCSCSEDLLGCCFAEMFSTPSGSNTMLWATADLPIPGANAHLICFITELFRKEVEGAEEGEGKELFIILFEPQVFVTLATDWSIILIVFFSFGPFNITLSIFESFLVFWHKYYGPGLSVLSMHQTLIQPFL